MRITRLLLLRYGHLSEVDLAFPAEAGLHVLLGPNEAGKSTALAAIGDCLFGFPHRTPYDFRYGARDLRIGIGLAAADGRAGVFYRRKGRRDDLTDAQDQPLAESTLAAFLGGVTRAQFERVFGLDGAALRAGGQAILAGHGDAGESILHAQTGLAGVRALAERLGEQAAALYGNKHRKRAFHDAVDAFKANRTLLDQRSVEPAEYRKAREERDRLSGERDAAALETQALQAERARLDRIRRTAPARAALARDIPARAALGPVPSLPEDAERTRQAAVTAREQLAHDLLRERAAAAAVRGDLAALVTDAALLADGVAIDALVADRSRIISTERDRETQRGEAARAGRALEDAAGKLGVAGDAERLLACIPDALRRERAARAVSAYERLDARRDGARQDLDAAQTKTEEAAAKLAAWPEPMPSAALRAAIEAAKAEGRIDAELAAAERKQQAAAQALATALTVLPAWTGTADALAAMPLPLAPLGDRAGRALAEAEAADRDGRKALAEREAALAGIAADLQGQLGAGDLPTADAIAAARDRRDRAWRLLRRQHIEHGSAPQPDEVAGLGEAASLPAAFEALLHGADALADRRANEAQRVFAYEDLLQRRAREHALRAQATTAAEAAAHALTQARTQWVALWQPAGILPLDPASMTEWLRRRGDVLSRRETAQEAARLRDTLVERHTAAWSPLAALLAEQAREASGRLAVLLGAAERICGEREAAHAARYAAETALAAAQEGVTKQRGHLARLDADLAAWHESWRATSSGLGLPPEADVATAKQALQLWNDVDLKAARLHAARTRIAEMTETIDADAATAAQVFGRLAPDLDGHETHAAVRALAGRLGTARDADATRLRLTAQHQRLDGTIKHLEQQHDTAERTLAVLRGLAGAADDAALQDAIARAARHAGLSRDIRDREAELHGQSDGHARADLDTEAAGIDADTLPPRIAGIDERLHAIDGDKEARATRLADLDRTLRDMEHGHDALAAAQAMQDALADVDDIAGRFVRLRLAQTLLGAAVEHFRRRLQGPLLAHAGTLFARLTEGRYDRLDVDQNDKGEPVVMAHRPDGSECPADRLSLGTRDQLYLALRLAAIADSGATLPFIADDLLVNFDDRRARAALLVLADFGRRTQTILFTHHAHIAAIAEAGIAPVHQLPATPGLVPA